MSTYHDVDGEPCTGSRYLLTELLRAELGYKGFVTADGGAVERLYHLRLANSLPEAAARALKAGCDMESGHPSLAGCGKMLRDALREGLIAETDLDLAARRVLRVKFEMGWFDKPASFDSSVLRSSAHRELALRAAHESIVMVKNNGVLPLKSCRIALTGPNAANAMNQLGDYTAFQRPGAISTVLDALKAEPDCEVRFEPGCRIRSMDRSGFAAAVAAAEKSPYSAVPAGTMRKRRSTRSPAPSSEPAATPPNTPRRRAAREPTALRSISAEFSLSSCANSKRQESR